MGAQVRNARDPVTAPTALWQALSAEPYRHDFFWAMRRIECHYADRPRLGTALRPGDEPIRLGQEPALDFAPASLSGFHYGKEGRPPRMEVRFFGLFGPNGPLPIHLTDFARERILHHSDRSFARFADVFHHRLLLLFYRAWAQAQPTVALDRPAEDRFAAYVGSTMGIGTPVFNRRDALPDHAKLYFSGLFGRQVRNADGLEGVVRGYFRLPGRVEQFVGHWLNLPTDQRTRLQKEPAPGGQLGVGAVLGRRVWDRQHRFRIHFGPLRVTDYLRFLPDGDALDRLVAIVRQYIGFELDWDLRLTLVPEDVPRARLGRGHTRLGWTSWMGGKAAEAAARRTAELILEPEMILKTRRMEAPDADPALASAYA